MCFRTRRIQRSDSLFFPHDAWFLTKTGWQIHSFSQRTHTATRRDTCLEPPDTRLDDAILPRKLMAKEDRFELLGKKKTPHCRLGAAGWVASGELPRAGVPGGRNNHPHRALPSIEKKVFWLGEWGMIRLSTAAARRVAIVASRWMGILSSLTMIGNIQVDRHHNAVQGSQPRR
jgi:hypothetical protein